MRWTQCLLLTIMSVCVTSRSLEVSRRWHNDITEMHSWNEVPQGWELVSPAPQNHILRLRIGLKEARTNELVDTLLEVSDPAHVRYGHHLSSEELQDLVAPHPSTISLISEWLSYHGIDPSPSIMHTTPSKDFVTLKVTISQAETLLNAKYGVYNHTASGRSVVRTLSYSLPKELHQHVNMIAPTTYFGAMRTMRVNSFIQPEISAIKSGTGSEAVPASCATHITPACLRELYGTAGYIPKATKVNQLGITGYLEQFASNTDLQSFLTQFRPDAVGSTFATTLINGGENIQSDPGIEASLDLQYTMGISFPTPNIFFSTGGEPPFIPDDNEAQNGNEPYLDFLNFILAQPKIPQVITTSYGDDEQTVPKDYATAVCNLFAQLGARGTSVIFASGDFGVGQGDCKTNDGTNRVVFNPDFPASCPFVTTVGATTQIGPEVATHFSGGGFSNYFSQPAYQKNAVGKFLHGLGDEFSGLFNAAGRGYPDVAAQGSGFQGVFNGTNISVGGTSASAPTFASVISLLNDFRLSHGKPSLGFLNPLLYSYGSKGLTDITIGSNPGCGTPGFNATAGWDPVTGLGTPDFIKLQRLVS